MHEQRKQLERAKTGDLLKAKIQKRPDRQELERRHILEHDESHIDPSLAEKQRMLKKSLLANQLNFQLSNRPGPLELIQKNILHTEESIERIVKDGLISFKATSEGLLTRPQHPSSYITYEDDSQSSEGDLRQSPIRSDVIEAAAASAGITVSLTNGGTVVLHPIISTQYVPIPPPLPPTPIKIEQIEIKSETPNLFAELCQQVTGSSPQLIPLAPSPISTGSNVSSLSPLSSVSSPQSIVVQQRPVPSPLQQQQFNQMKSDAPGKDKNRKKNKSKPVTKPRTIKFHEYKGPPNAQNNNNLNHSSSQSGETSYQLLMEQKRLLMKLQGMIPKPEPDTNQQQFIVQTFQQQSSPQSTCSSIPPPSPAPSETTSAELNKLEKMKVADLKMLLKKRNLPVSGPKPQLIERLRPFLPLEQCESINTESCNFSDITDLDDRVNSPKHSLSPPESEQDMDVQLDSPSAFVAGGFSNAELVREQQRTIEELQKQLREKHDEIAQIKQHQVCTDKPDSKLIFKQQLEAKIQKEKLQQLENLQRQQIQLANIKNEPILLVVSNGHQPNTQMSSILVPIKTGPTPIIETFVQQPIQSQINEIKPPPPLYEEATKQIENLKKEEPKSHVKSQVITDILEILIKQGELPPSAANIPSTPIIVDSNSYQDSSSSDIDVLLGESPTNSDLTVNEQDPVEMPDFSPWQYEFELINQELGMDVADESHQHQTNYPIDIIKPKREMDPSLQPSINELIQQNHSYNEFNSPSSNNNYSFSHNFNLNNNQMDDQPMDVDFATSLSNFDIRSFADNNSIDTPPHPFSSLTSQAQDQDITDSHYATSHDNIFNLNLDDFKMSSDTISWDIDFPLNCH